MQVCVAAALVVRVRVKWSYLVASPYLDDVACVGSVSLGLKNSQKPGPIEMGVREWRIGVAQGVTLEVVDCCSHYPILVLYHQRPSKGKLSPAFLI